MHYDYTPHHPAPNRTEPNLIRPTYEDNNTMATGGDPMAGATLPHEGPRREAAAAPRRSRRPQEQHVAPFGSAPAGNDRTRQLERPDAQGLHQTPRPERKARRDSSEHAGTKDRDHGEVAGTPDSSPSPRAADNEGWQHWPRCQRGRRGGRTHRRPASRAEPAEGHCERGANPAAGPRAGAGLYQSPSRPAGPVRGKLYGAGR